MDIWSLKLHRATWTVINLLCVFSHDVTVRYFDLKLCEEDKQVCVTDLRDCGPRPPSSVLKTLNMSCYYQISERSMTCEWSEEAKGHTESEVSLIFRSRDKVLSCPAVFNPVAVLSVTARIKNYMTGTEIWSQPHTVVFYNAVKPSQPVLTVLGFTADSVDVFWMSSSDGSCQLRYRVNHTNIWSQAPDSIPAHRGQVLTHTIKDLLPFTDYIAAVACRESNIWSDWSSDVSVRTLERVPSKSPKVCYRVERTDPGGSLLLHLMWKDLELHDAGGHILGYQVSYEPAKKQQLQDRLIQNVTELTALLLVEEGNFSITVTAFNMAGYGPAAHLSIDTQRQNTLPSVRNMWVSSSFPAMKSLLVQWENPTAPHSVPPLSHFAVQWHSETHPSTNCWTTMSSFTTSTVIQDVDPGDTHLISVFPVYNQQCGSPQSLPASLQQGALMEAVKLKVVDVTKTAVTIGWTWQRKSGSIRVNRYRVMLRKGSERVETLPLWPDQCHHTLTNLTPNTEYSLILLADNVSRNIIPVKTDFDVVPAVATATPLLLLAVTVFIISILSRTIYKSYFFPPISSPWGSTAGQWLMDPHPKKTAERNILNIEDFQVTDVLGEKSLIIVGPSSQSSSEEDLHEDTSLLSISHLSAKLSALELDTEYVCDAPVITENQLVSLQSYHPDYTVNCQHPDRVFFSEQSREADSALPHQTHEANSCFPQKQEESRLVDSSVTLHQKETAVKACFFYFMANTNSRCVYQMTCEEEYVVNSSFLGKTDVETESGQSNCSHLICENDYIASSCFNEKTADEDRTA
ncbi:interleukin-6 receptor subunit beta isoform X1 [Dicentrarchus labrax]|uniref:interleukin-6 receptor subunit beta isoform X1 n=1 Tax=Dicentrarchus labrax TaxID=13489 RepID=UPI0021F61AE6|nr:interleukin-6 receptor subunit beta isoform X1 [Dicentrarchus labrax]